MPPRVQLAVGLGNPGPKYEDTRHNAGVWWIDGLARRLGASFRPVAKFHGETGEARTAAGTVRLLKPTTYMNQSGRAVAALANFYRIPAEAVLVAHDEIDLPAGQVRLKRGGGDGGHRGLRDIIPAIGAGFLRLRIGVGRPEHSEDVTDYVLRRPGAAEREAVDGAIAAALDRAEDMLAGDAQAAMNILHRRDARVDRAKPGGA